MPRILMVDDDANFVEATQALLEAKNHTVSFALDGETGYVMAQKDPPDLILLDVMMSRETEGFDLARRLKENPKTKGIPIITITGIRKAKGLPEGFGPDPDWLPVSAVLEKPVKPDLLLAAVENTLKR